MFLEKRALLVTVLRVNMITIMMNITNRAQQMFPNSALSKCKLELSAMLMSNMITINMLIINRAQLINACRAVNNSLWTCKCTVNSTSSANEHDSALLALHVCSTNVKCH